MGTPVIKLAQPGYDVKTCGDENLIYSSLWPLLKIYAQGPFTIPSARQTITIATHDLQYPPMYWYFANTNIISWENLTIASDNRSEFFGPIGDGTLSMDSGKLFYTASLFPFASGPSQLYYYIFALDLTTQYTAPIISVGSQQAASGSSHVFKVAKEGKSISSNDLDDYVIHSRARSPLIHSVNPSPGPVKSFTVTHNLGYVPMFFGYLKNTDGSYSLIPSGGSALGSNLNAITFTSVAAQEMTIVVLKDPFVVDYSVRVNV